MKIKENSFTYILICVSLLYFENSIFYDFFNQHRYKIGNLKIKSSISSSLHIFNQSKRKVKPLKVTLTLTFQINGPFVVVLWFFTST